MNAGSEDASHARSGVRRARRALFTAADETAEETAGAGRGALDDASAGAGSRGEKRTGAPGSENAGATGGGKGPTVTVECSWCGATTRRPLRDVAGEAVRPFAWWVPLKRHSRWLTCTACGSRAWCRVDWLSALRDG